MRVAADRFASATRFRSGATLASGSGDRRLPVGQNQLGLETPFGYWQTRNQIAALVISVIQAFWTRCDSCDRLLRKEDSSPIFQFPDSRHRRLSHGRRQWLL